MGDIYVGVKCWVNYGSDFQSAAIGLHDPNNNLH